MPAGTPFNVMDGKIEEAEAYRELQNWRAQIVTGQIASPRDGQVRVSELWADVVNDYIRREHRSLEGAKLRWERNPEPFFGKMRAANVTNADIEAYIRKRFSDPSPRGQVRGTTIGRELGLLRRCYKLGMRGNPPKVRVMPYFPQFKDHKRTGMLEFEKHDELAMAFRTLDERWRVPLEAVFETAYTFGWRHGEIVPLRVYQYRDLDLTHARLHLEADTTKNFDARDVPLGPWCMRLIELLRELVKGKQPDDLIFTRGKNNRPMLRFDKLWKIGCRMAGVSDDLRVHDLRRTAAQRMLDAGIPETRIMGICGWKTRAMFQRYAMTGRSTLRNELKKLEKFERRQRQGRQELVQQEEMRKSEQSAGTVGRRKDYSPTTRAISKSVRVCDHTG